MDKVIGLGRMGCAVAEELSTHPEYRIYKIDADTDERASLSVGTFVSMDEYEKNVDQGEVSIYLRSVRAGDDVLVIVEGGDPVSGAALKILECIKESHIHVLYICPERDMISQINKRDDKIAFNIFQQYARSGVFEKLFLVNKTNVESLMGDVSVQNYEKSIGHFISYVVAMINYFNHTEPKISNKIKSLPYCRIATYGVSSLEDANEDTHLLFPLDEVTDIHFYYGIPTTDVTGDATLMKKIKNHAKRYASSGQSVSFSVYETSFDQMMVLCTAFSHKIQQLGIGV
jgi:hypothetical protein|tara:strand:+ start:2293 stop:3153 length:861 start_codon:yes stop_codon:yes gene_type:complete